MLLQSRLSKILQSARRFGFSLEEPDRLAAYIIAENFSYHEEDSSHAALHSAVALILAHISQTDASLVAEVQSGQLFVGFQHGDDRFGSYRDDYRMDLAFIELGTLLAKSKKPFKEVGGDA